MKSVLLGVRGLDFPGGDGRRVEGTQLFLAYPSEGVIGQESCKVFVQPNSCPSNIQDYIGAEIDVAYNNKGKVIGIEL
ncbi:hypothetical protein D7Y09_16060 [bacterium 1XD42-1]|nr:hypothetical protein D7X25_29010 [bacterium 1XD42-8]RKJ61295.1 hypothetical protein D7Y09_16060 [bacterium 1XD42-1]